jgi:hypothetical protein
MNIDIDQIADDLIKIVTKYQFQFYNMERKESQLLELSALIFTTEYYKESGYTVEPKNLTNDTNEFYIKIKANAKPYKYSFFELTKGRNVFEVHANLPVRGCFDENGIFIVDVGVVIKGSIPLSLQDQKDWKAVPNKRLVTFLEVKKLVVYPMLLAQFVGIVHEIKCVFLNGRLPNNFKKNSHLFPSLITVGYLSGTSSKIIDGFKKRKYKIKIIPDFDKTISLLRWDGSIKDITSYNSY